MRGIKSCGKNVNHTENIRNFHTSRNAGIQCKFGAQAVESSVYTNQ